jgi:Raf kinase inhibitor-like YbhB/YbcL family protein
LFLWHRLVRYSKIAYHYTKRERTTMLKKTTLILLILISIICLIIGGCGSGTTPTTTPAPAVSTTEPAETTATTTHITTTAAVPTTTTTAPTTTVAVPSVTPTIEPTTSAAATPTPTPTPTPEPVVFTLTSTAFTEGQPIPAVHGFNSGNKSPELDWVGAPEGTASFVLIMEDPDGDNWSHWVIFNLGANIEGLGVDQPKMADIGDGVKQGTNSFMDIGYDGPSPPSGIHHYYFHLYALDTMLALNGGATREQVRSAMQGHILGETVLMGTFQG